jgi:hypothetical protein
MKFFALLLCCLAASVAYAEPKPDAYVTQQKFNKLIEIMKRMHQRILSLEEALEAGQFEGAEPKVKQELNELKKRLAQMEKGLNPATPSAEDEVDLDALDLEKKIPKPGPVFKVYFDLNFYSMPGASATSERGLTFDNFHSFILLDVVPSPDIHFMTDVNPSPKFYELDYQINDWFTMRFGKIFVPFDDMHPHSIYGGRTNVSRLSPDGNFLPDLFTDLGIGLDFKLANSPTFKLDAKLCAVNGFRSGGTDPVTANSAYPNFSAELPTSADNNRDKSFCGRAHALFSGTFGIGASYFTGRWSSSGTESQRLSIIGVDSQLYLGKFSLRVGQANMVADLPATASKTNFSRGANYLEAALKLDSQSKWRTWGRAGTQNLDNRIVDKNDRAIVGGGLAYKPSLVEFSIEHSRDTKRTADKTNYSFTNFRVVASF